MISSWKSSCLYYIPQRWVFVFMGFLAVFLSQTFRSVLSITITEMVLINETPQNSGDDTCPHSNLETSATNHSSAVSDFYNWDEYTQGVILSSYFWGYIITQCPSGYLAEKYGGKQVLGLGIGLSAILTVLTPYAVKIGDSTALILVRVAMGLFSGSVYPAISSMMSQWIVPSEKARSATFVYAGISLGSVVCIYMTSLLEQHPDYGWTQAYYVFGLAGLVWYLLWMVLCYNSAEVHPFISESEAKYIEEHLRNQRQQKPPPAPVLQLMTSLPVWAFIVAIFGVDYTFYVIATDLPKYMRSVMKISIDDNAYLSSLPYLSMWLSALGSSWLSDWLITKEVMSMTNVRKLFASLSLWGAGIFIVGASFAKCDQLLVVIMFVCASSFMGCSHPSVFVNSLDLTPNYAGTLFGIGNCIASLGGIFAPYVVGILTPNQTLGEWRLVFWIVFIVSVISNLFFLMFASGRIQEWNDFELYKKQRSASRDKKCNNVKTIANNL